MSSFNINEIGIGIRNAGSDFSAYVTGKVTSAQDTVTDYMSNQRKSKIIAGEEGETSKAPSAAKDAETNSDWRVRLSLPMAFGDLPAMLPLQESGGQLVFPYTPSVTLSNSASYNAIKPIHSNYPFYAYQNSSTDQITIAGEFTVEKEFEARYWLSAIHYLRSVSKMAYGLDAKDRGSPPPVVRLNGYGKHVFNDVPVVLTSFATELPNDVDYIKCNFIGEESHAPCRSTITVQLQPLYSRKTVESFNFESFIAGEYVTKGGKFI